MKRKLLTLLTMLALAYGGYVDSVGHDYVQVRIIRIM